MARDLNTIALCGRLTKDCQVKTFDNGGSIISFSIANNDTKKNRDGKYEDVTSYFDIEYHTKSSGVSEYLQKGKFVSLSGKLKQQRWEDNGQTKSKVFVLADQINLITTSDNSTKVPKTEQNQNIEQTYNEQEFVDDNDIPF